MQGANAIPQHVGALLAAPFATLVSRAANPIL